MNEKRIAIMYHLLPDCLGYGGFLQRGLEQLCHVEHFIPGEEPEGFDEYLYIDDGPTYYMEPKYHPATYFAMDMVVRPFWYLEPVDRYVERCRNFDRVFFTSTASQKYAAERGVAGKMLGFAADPAYHKPYPVPRDLDWIAVWHNCGDRVEACNRAMERFPSGQVCWIGNEGYAEKISQGKCALNWLRGDIVNMRAFEVMATGTPLINTRHEDMAWYGFQEDVHYLGFEGIDEMLDKIEWVLTHPDQANLMAIRARALICAKHTYYNRALEILDDHV